MKDKKLILYNKNTTKIQIKNNWKKIEAQVAKQNTEAKTSVLENCSAWVTWWRGDQLP